MSVVQQPSKDELEATRAKVVKVSVFGLKRTRDSLVRPILSKFEEATTLAQVCSFAKDIQSDFHELDIFKNGVELWIDVPRNEKNQQVIVKEPILEDGSIPLHVSILVKEVAGSYGLFAGMDGPFPEAVSVNT